MKKVLFMAGLICFATIAFAQQPNRKDSAGLVLHRVQTSPRHFFGNVPRQSMILNKDSLMRRQAPAIRKTASAIRFTAIAKDSIHTPAVYKNEPLIIKP